MQTNANSNCNPNPNVNGCTKMRGGRGGLRSIGSKPGGKRSQKRVGGGFRNQFRKRNTRQNRKPRTTTNVTGGSSGGDAYRADGVRKQRVHNVNRNSTLQPKKELNDENARAYIEAAKALIDCSWMDSIKDEGVILAGRALLAKVEPTVKLKPLTLTRVRKLVRRRGSDKNVAIAACFLAAMSESNTEVVESALITQTRSQERKVLVLYAFGEMLKELEKFEDNTLLRVLTWSVAKLIIANDETISLLSDDQILQLQRCMTKVVPCLPIVLSNLVGSTVPNHRCHFMSGSHKSARCGSCQACLFRDSQKYREISIPGSAGN